MQIRKGLPPLIAQVYGIYEFKIQFQPAICLMVMKNSIQKVFQCSQISFTFDLKGSKIGRQVLENSTNKVKFKSLTLKDQDLLYLLKQFDSQLLCINQCDRRKIIQAIKADTQFLASKNIMDYSLLLAVEDISQKAQHEDGQLEDQDFIDDLMVKLDCEIPRKNSRNLTIQ